MKQKLPPLGLSFNRLQSIALVLSMLCTIAAPLAVQLAGRTTDPSVIDNRPPHPLPPLPTSWGEAAAFRDELDKFLADNYGLRVEMVKLDALVSFSIGVSSVPGLLAGRDGWIFLKDNSDILNQYRGLNRFTPTELDAWIDTEERYQRWLNAQGIDYVLVVAPNQQTIYPDYMPAYATRVGPNTRLDQLVERLKTRNSSLIVIDPRPELWKAREQRRVYYKHENHWNAVGSFVAYSCLMKRLDQVVPNLVQLRMSDFTIGRQKMLWSYPPFSEVAPTLVSKKPSNITDKLLLTRIQDRDVYKTFTRNVDRPGALLIGDSFSWTLNDYIQESFGWSIYVMGNVFPTKLIKEHRPRVVINELVERYLIYPPKPADDPSALADISTADNSTGK